MTPVPCSSPFETWESELEEGKADETVLQFQRLIEKAIVREKKTLFQKLREDDKAWRRWARIIERKFDDWNIKWRLGLSGEKERQRSRSTSR